MYGYDCTSEDIMVLKIGITQEFARRYGMSIRDVVSLFEKNGIYPFIEDGADQFITKTYPYMASFIGRKLGMS